MPEGNWELAVAPGVRIIFVPLKTEAHFTNYKPDFMLHVESLAGAENEALIYCDPDIVINVEWSYIEDWLTCGIVLCNDVNSPLAENHPRRVGWRRFFKQHGFDLNFRTTSHANGGFVGLTLNHRKFLLLWQDFMTHIAEFLGGREVVGEDGEHVPIGMYGFARCLSRTDQDALNAALEALPEIPLSFLGRDAMGFEVGETILPHALGGLKPWKSNYILRGFSGFPPGKVDKAFWSNAEGPLQPFTKSHVSSVRTQLAMGSALGRFVKRAY